MKKILFNDKYGLTQAVLEGRKTQTRRLIKCRKTFKGEWVAGFNIHIRPSDKKVVGLPCMYDADESEFDGGEILPKYKVGEVVAVAQSYETISNAISETESKEKAVFYCKVMKACFPNAITHKDKEEIAGWYNKMFVRGDLMPNQIRITDVRVEKLQEISEDCCLKEGIQKMLTGCEYYQYSFYDNDKGLWNNYKTPREAFAHLLNKVSRKDVWNENPYVFVYDFELVK